jgi:hypothetical protein
MTSPDEGGIQSGRDKATRSWVLRKPALPRETFRRREHRCSIQEDLLFVGRHDPQEGLNVWDRMHLPGRGSALGDESVELEILSSCMKAATAHEEYTPRRQ